MQASRSPGCGSPPTIEEATALYAAGSMRGTSLAHLVLYEETMEISRAMYGPRSNFCGLRDWLAGDIV